MERTTNRELAARIAARTHCPEVVALEVLNHLDDEITLALIAGERVELTGLGTFRLIKRKATNRRLPGEAVMRVNGTYDVGFAQSVRVDRAFAASLPPIVDDEVPPIDNGGTLGPIDEDIEAPTDPVDDQPPVIDEPEAEEPGEGRSAKRGKKK